MQEYDAGTSSDKDDEGPALTTLPELPSGQFYVERIVAKKAMVWVAIAN